ncbi:hypothetical protein TNCV_2391831 [Trichonephila clavipes]|nr:hypothetical protein TNCV_2391831 [Trichonephila clavipes]
MKNTKNLLDQHEDTAQIFTVIDDDNLRVRQLKTLEEEAGLLTRRLGMRRISIGGGRARVVIIDDDRSVDRHLCKMFAPDCPNQAQLLKIWPKKSFRLNHYKLFGS